MNGRGVLAPGVVSRGFRRSGAPGIVCVAAACMSLGALVTQAAPPPGREDQKPTPAWLAGATETIRQSEYRFGWDDRNGAWSAPNRAHDLRTRVRRGGIEVVSRVEDDAGFILELFLHSFGRPGAMQAAAPARLAADGRRVRMNRGPIVEWLENREIGVEHGFTIDVRPPGEGDVVILAIALQGSLSAHPEGDRSVLFKDAAGAAILRYTDLLVKDAAGDMVPARLLIGDGEVRIVMDDRYAVYPLEVDPILQSPTWTADGGQDYASFGVSVGTAGDVNGDGFADIVIGAYLFDGGQADEGRAFVFHGSAAGLAPVPAWTAESDQAYSGFGYVVGTAGDVNGDGHHDVLVGVPQNDDVFSDEGRVVVYHGSSLGLATTPSWSARGGQHSSRFGSAAAGAGDVNGDGFADVVIGAPWTDGIAPDQGSAFVFTGSATGLSAAPVWSADGGQAGELFGSSVATGGDLDADGYDEVIVGAESFDDEEVDEGRAQVFRGSGSGPAMSASWAAEGDQDGARLGAAVALAGDVDGDGYADLLVGAPSHDGTRVDEGRALLYQGSTTGPSVTADWTMLGGQIGAGCGTAVAPAGDVNGDGYADVLIGAHAYDGGQIDEGRAWLHLGSSTGLAPVAAWIAEGDQIGAGFARAIAAAGDVNGDGYGDFLVGAPLFDATQTDEGRVFAYRGAASGVTAGPGWAVLGNQTDSYFGYSAASAGDVNGDGYGDVIIGADWYDGGQVDEGRAFVFQGSASGLAAFPAWMAAGPQSGCSFGISVASAGDVNGDGYGDVIVGAYLFSNGQSEEGGAFVFHGSPSGLAPSPAWSAEGNTRLAEFGISVAPAGDVNGDGYGDVIVGADGYKNGETEEGGAFVFLGSAAGLAAAPAWTAESDQPGAFFGISVAPAGDVNGDGFSDVIVGADLYDAAVMDAGRAFVYPGSATGLAATPAWTAEGTQVLSEFGFVVAAAGDVNGDGFSDVAVGAFLHDAGQIDEGRVFIYHGSPSGPSPAPSWTAEANQIASFFGISVAAAGDANGDGYGDLVVGATWFDGAQRDEGRAFLFTGSASGLSSLPAWDAGSGQALSDFGVVVASAGDVNGDGFADLIVGADIYDDALLDEGAVFLYFGAGRGLGRIPRQVRADGLAPIGPLGKSDASDAFRVRAIGRTPAGRGRVRIEVEAKPLGTPFDGTGIIRSAAYADTGPPLAGGSAVDLDLLIGSLVPGTPYRWRQRIRTDSPFFAVSSWVSPPPNSPTETDLRTAPGAPDGDGDGVPAGSDCDDTNLNVWSVPGEARDLVWPGAAGVLAWAAPLEPGGLAAGLVYDTLRAGGAAGFDNATCIESDAGPDTTASDAAAPPPGTAFYYLVRAQNACGAGSLGFRSDGTPRTGKACP